MLISNEIYETPQMLVSDQFHMKLELVCNSLSLKLSELDTLDNRRNCPEN